MSKRTFHISKLKPSVFQGSFDFETVSKKQTRALAIEYPAERAAFAILVGALALLICAYFYFVIASVFNVIGERQADAEASGLQGTIASLEEQYFALSQALTPEEASDLGLTPVKETSYVYQPGNAASIPSPVHAI